MADPELGAKRRKFKCDPNRLMVGPVAVPPALTGAAECPGGGIEVFGCEYTEVPPLRLVLGTLGVGTGAGGT